MMDRREEIDGLLALITEVEQGLAVKTGKMSDGEVNLLAGVVSDVRQRAIEIDDPRLTSRAVVLQGEAVKRVTIIDREPVARARQDSQR